MSADRHPWWVHLVAAHALRAGGTAISAQPRTLHLFSRLPNVRCCIPADAAGAGTGGAVVLDTTAVPTSAAEQVSDLPGATGFAADLVIGDAGAPIPTGLLPVGTSAPGLWIAESSPLSSRRADLAAHAHGIASGRLDAFDLLAGLIGLQALSFRGDGNAMLHFPPASFCEMAPSVTQPPRLHREIPVQIELPALGIRTARVEIALSGTPPCLRPLVTATGGTELLTCRERGTDEQLLVEIDALSGPSNVLGLKLAGHRMRIERVSLRLGNPVAG